MAFPPVKPGSVSAQQPRLILQDPRVGEEAPLPALRLSLDLGTIEQSGLDRESAQKIWETLQLKPETIIANQVQLREANAKLELVTQQMQAAKADAVQLQAKLHQIQETRWQHPLVYGSGVAFLGLGWLWLAERKKRLAAQEHASVMFRDVNSVLEMPEGPSSMSQIPSQMHSLMPETVQEPVSPTAPALISDPIAHAITAADLLPYVAPKPVAALVFQAPAPWWKLGAGKPKPAKVSGAKVSGAKVQAAARRSTVAEHPDPAPDTFIDSVELEDMHAPKVSSHDAGLANVELLAQTRLKPASSDDAMGHLLEIRMAVEALIILGQPDAAQKLLHQHIDAVPNTCGWAYMEYLDLSAQLGQREAFEGMRKRYRLQFNRLAPYWMEPNAAVQSLDNYERPIAELCAAWYSPERTKMLISTWLQGTLHSRRLFQLPAYRDLLDLYEMMEFFDDNSSAGSDFVPTVSLLDLDYEFAIDVKIQPQSSEDMLRAVPTVKTGDFAVDFNLTQGPSDLGALTPIPDTPKAARPQPAVVSR